MSTNEQPKVPVSAFQAWYKNAVDKAANFSAIPEGTVVVMDDHPPVTLVGDTLLAFQLGVMSGAECFTLPDDESVATDATA